MRRVARIKRGKRRRSRSNAWLPAPHPATTTYCLLGWCCIPFDCSTLGMACVETDLNTQKIKKSIKQTKYHPQNPSLISIFTTQVISLVLCTESIQAPCAVLYLQQDLICSLQSTAIWGRTNHLSAARSLPINYRGNLDFLRLN